MSGGAGRIITFYSYKGGTGRSMALANAAWIIASNGYRVLVVDWDLEAPGLHRYFAPFMLDPELVESDGVIDIVSNYVTALMTPTPESTTTEAKESEVDTAWHEPYADVLRYASSLTWRFPVHEGRQGWIDLVPAGRQGGSYAARMNSFNWQNFYDRLGGGGFIEALKKRMKAEYDYVLIDSRTGVSDTSGVCTVQLPDTLVVCFTLNRQSIEGASAVAASVAAQRSDTGSDSHQVFRVFPIPTRVEKAEKDKLDLAHDAAADFFAPVIEHIETSRQKQYWGDVEVLYEPYYAYEEVLCTLKDSIGLPTSMLASMERITSWVTDGVVSRLVAGDEAERQRGLAMYARQARKSRGKSPGAGTQEFLFYISYARADLDESLERFFTDLSHEVRTATGMPTSSSPGFVDLDIAAGTDWQQQLERGVQTSRVLVPIYSLAYFDSENTGREFQAFLSRASSADSEPTGILPVIWVQPPQLPAAAQRIAFTSGDLPDVYKNLGLRSLMRLRRYEDVYLEFLREYTRRLIEMARQVPLPSQLSTPLVQMPNAFAESKLAVAPLDPSALASPERTESHFARERLESLSPSVRRAAVAALGRRGTRDDIGALALRLADEDERVRAGARLALADVVNRERRGGLEVRLDEATIPTPDDSHRQAELGGLLASLGELRGLDLLVSQLDNPADRVRTAVAQGLGISGRFQVPSATGEGWRSCA